MYGGSADDRAAHTGSFRPGRPQCSSSVTNRRWSDGARHFPDGRLGDRRRRHQILAAP
jgi:hypothetical protein